jgi:hypothetical protein
LILIVNELFQILKLSRLATLTDKAPEKLAQIIFDLEAFGVDVYDPFDCIFFVVVVVL